MGKGRVVFNEVIMDLVDGIFWFFGEVIGMEENVLVFNLQADF